jgi:hypothetical protein
VSPPLKLPVGTLPPPGTGWTAPCCDVFVLADGKIRRFDCYPEGSVILTQLGVRQPRRRTRAQTS